MPPWRLPDTAHPRSRGENINQRQSQKIEEGSSPLTRGKPLPSAGGDLRSRLIPAHAGKTDDTGGESRVIGGSSPLTRGKPGELARRVGDAGLIPAHAGKTSTRRPTSARARVRAARGCWAHPRSRGENEGHRRASSSASGSSPLTRGKHDLRRHDQDQTGLIPAHAGKTYVAVTVAPGGAAHPRSRGENAPRSPRDPQPAGSSPLTRGKHLCGLADASRRGLIPAHAGKTSMWTGRRFTARAHPRSRGENFACGAAIAKNVGSSPLTRGKRPAPARRGQGDGLIPAHAGKTSRPRIKPSMTRAHPRSRGENRAFDVLSVGRMGSSPLTRGKLPDRNSTVGELGLIPAHAGKT